MTPDAELRALTQSIGEHAVDAFGKENLQALSVLLDPFDFTATINVALRDDSMDAMLAVGEAFADLEELYLMDAVLRLRFLAAAEIESAPVSSQPSYAMV